MTTLVRTKPNKTFSSLTQETDYKNYTNITVNYNIVRLSTMHLFSHTLMRLLWQYLSHQSIIF